MLQRVALKQLHDDERSALVFSDIVNGANIRMIQSGSRARFALKSFERGRIGRRVLEEKLERHISVEPRVFGFVDHAHAAAPELFYDAIVRNCAANDGL